MPLKKKKKRISGTREWAASTCNCVTGCQHDCKYCYARYDMVDRYHRMTAERWKEERVREKDVNKKRGRMDGVVMFPTTHDITPNILQPCLKVLRNLVNAGNAVLVVSKPHLECIREIIRVDKEGDGIAKGSFRDHVMFRFTIGARSDKILKHWEPGAPSFAERLACLSSAHIAGFRTSVSCEPLLEADAIDRMVKMFEPYVSDSIWIGKLNHIDRRVRLETEIDFVMARKVKEGQTDEVIKAIYERFKKHKLIRWKESYKDVLGLDLAEEAGLDV